MGQLTVADRVLLHLFPHQRLRGKPDCPPHLTQDGIAQALALARAHVALELKKLEARGLVETQVAHVTGGRARRKVYFPTPAGAQRVVDLRSGVLGQEMEYIDASGARRRATVEDLLRTLHRVPQRDLAVMEALYLGRTLDVRGLEREAPADVRAPPMVGRGEELGTLSRYAASDDVVLVGVHGVAGIGKTRLVREALRGHDVLWLQLFPGEGPRAALGDLALVLEKRGRPGLRNFLRTHPPQGNSLRNFLRGELHGLRVVLDDLNPNPENLTLVDLLVGGPGAHQVWTVGREALPTHPWVDLPSGAVRGLHLQGLGLEASRELLRLRRKDPPATVVEELHRLTGGNPLCLHLVHPDHLGRPFQDMEEFMEEEILAGLHGPQERILYTLVPHRRPVERAALGGAATRDLRPLLRRCLVLQEDGMYRLHDLVRGFLAARLGPEGMGPWEEAALAYHRDRGSAEALPLLARLGRAREAKDFLGARWTEVLDAGAGEEALATMDALGLAVDPAMALVRARIEDKLARWSDAMSTLARLGPAVDPAVRYEAQLLTGRIRSKSGDPRGALDDLRAAARTARTLGDGQREAEVLRAMALVHSKRRGHGTGLRLLTRAARVLGDGARPEDRGRIDMDLATILLGQGRFLEALEPLQRAAGSLADPGELARVYNNIAYANTHLGRLNEARRAVRDAEDIARRRSDRRILAYATGTAAEISKVAGDLAAAVDLSRRSLAMAREVGEPFLVEYMEAFLAGVEGGATPPWAPAPGEAPESGLASPGTPRRPARSS